MSETDENSQRLLQEEEEVAKMYARRGDSSKIVALLRKLHRPYEIPDLWFIADLLEEKPKKRAGRPANERTVSGLKAQRAALAVHTLIINRGLTVELAVEEASKELSMSESAVKQTYYKCLNGGMIPGS